MASKIHMNLQFHGFPYVFANMVVSSPEENVAVEAVLYVFEYTQLFNLGTFIILQILQSDV